MRRFSLVVLMIIFLSIFSVAAYTVDVQSASDKEIVLAFSGFNQVVPIQHVVATVETATISDTYVVDSKVGVSEGKLVVTVDVSDIFQDYAASEIEAITISGDADGTPFGKRIAYRGGTAVFFAAPGVANSFGWIYWVTGILALLVLIVLIYLLVSKPKKVHVMHKASKRKTKKKSKKKVSKKKSKKKTAKRKKTKRR